MAGVLLPKAQWVTNARNGGGTYAPGFDWRIVLHTIEGSASPAMIAGHAYPPHVWYDPATRQLWQTVPLDRFAFALEHPAGTIETNAARALQVEISGQAQNTPDWPQAWLDNLAEDVIVPMCQWVASVGGSIDLLDVPAPGAIPGSASEAAPQRFTEQAWQAFRGICGHRHVPNNIHWDPGALDTNHIAAHAALTVGGLLAAASTTEDEEMPKAYLSVADIPVLVSGLTYRGYNGRPWPDVLAGLLALEAEGRIERMPRDARGYVALPRISDSALALYREI